MSKTNTNTNRTRYAINDADTAEFILAVDGANKFDGFAKNSNGDIEIDLPKLDGKITIQVKSGKVVAKLGHRDFPRVEDQILFVKRYFSKKSLMALADALNAEIKVLTDKVAARNAKIQKKAEKPAKQQKNAAAEKTPAPVKTGTVEKKHGKNRLGHIYGTIADRLDQMFLAGCTEKDFEKNGISLIRAKGHFRHLFKDKASLVDVKFENGQYFAKYID